jgi:hypothetical protein
MLIGPQYNTRGINPSTSEPVLGIEPKKPVTGKVEILQRWNLQPSPESVFAAVQLILGLGLCITAFDLSHYGEV